MPSAVIDRVNQIGLSEGNLSLLTFYDHNDNPIGEDNTKIARVDKVPEVTRLDKETDEEPQDKYDSRYIDTGQDEKKDNQ